MTPRGEKLIFEHGRLSLKPGRWLMLNRFEQQV